MKPIIHCGWGLHTNFDYDKQIEIFVDDFVYKQIPNNTIRIIIIQESFNTQWLRDLVMNKANDMFYTYVFTHNQDILEKHDRAIHFLCICTWIHNYDFAIKKFGVSTLVGGKTGYGLEGYNIRHQLWHSKHLINIPHDFYLSSHGRYDNADYSNNLILGDYKEPMFNNQYHITIENTRLQNVFTEKIIDCFQTKTIPIYYGCPNLGDTFNMDGIIVVDNVNDIINVCNSLTPDLYESKLDAIEENYEKSKPFCNATEILDRKLSELFK